MLLAAAAFVLAGGFVHLREWLDSYRDLPAEVPGSALVRVGFPLTAVVSVAAAGALVLCALRPTRRAAAVIAGAVLFQLGALATLILSRTSSVLGWSEPVWTSGANQSRAVEIGALVCLAAAAALLRGEARGDRAAQGRAPAPATRPALPLSDDDEHAASHA